METRQQRINTLIQRRRRELLAWQRDRRRPEAKERQPVSTPVSVKTEDLLTGCENLHVEAKPPKAFTNKVITP